MMIIFKALRRYSLPKRNGDYLYNFKWDKFAKLVTFFTCLVIVGCVYLMFEFVDSPYYGWCSAIIAAAFIMFALISAPAAIYMGDKELEVHGLIEDIRIKYSTIKRIYPIESLSERSLSLRISTFGFMGYFGEYYDKIRKKRTTLMCSQMKNFVMIECTRAKSVIISVEERSQFIEEVNRRLYKLQLEYDDGTEESED